MYGTTYRKMKKLGTNDWDLGITDQEETAKHFRQKWRKSASVLFFLSFIK
jgi:hypothetical protein